jgi:putative ABC transport system permease protein
VKSSPNEFPIDAMPPRWPLKFIRPFLKAQYLEEIEGDMEEIFFNNVERMSLRKARWFYTVEMLNLLRPSLMKNMTLFNSITQYGMLRNYFKVSVRGLMKNPLSSFINVFGLSVAVGICLVVYAFMEFDRSIDQFHENKNEVYLTTFFANHDGVTG